MERHTIVLALRSLQVLFMIVCLGTSAYWASVFKKYGPMPDPLGFSIFACVTGLLLVVLMLVAPRVRALSRTLPGLFDLLMSWLWSDFFLAIFASLVGASRQLGAASFGAIPGMAFLLFLLFAATTVMAFLDIAIGPSGSSSAAAGSSSAAAGSNGSGSGKGKAAAGAAAKTASGTIPAVKAAAPPKAAPANAAEDKA